MPEFIAQFESDSADVYGINKINYWWHKAVRQWFQEKVSDPASFTKPSGFKGCETWPFNGLGLNLDYCGITPFVKHLAETEGDEVIGRIYEHIRDGQMFIDAILSSTSEPIYNWLPDFFDRYLQGGYYQVSTATLLKDVNGTFTIDSITDTLKTFYPECPQMGAQIYRIDLDYDSISTNATMDLTLQGSGINPDYLTILLYKCKDNALTYLDAGHDISLGDLRTLTNDGYDLIAVLVNSYGEAPYGSTSGLTLMVRVPTPPALNFNTIEIRILDITYECYEEWEDTDTTFQHHHGGSWKATGQFSGYTFTGSNSWGAGDHACSVSVSLTLDPVTMRVTGFEASEQCGNPYWTRNVTIRDVPGMELPFMEGWSDLNWQVVGSPQACGYFDYEGVTLGIEPQHVHWYQICSSPSCVDDGSQILISIYNE